MAEERVADREALPGDSDLFQSVLIFFAVVVLSTTEFVKDGFPLWDALRPSKGIVVYLIFLVQVLPAIALTGADWYIARRDKTGRIRRNFRRAVFAVAFVLILRQIQMYWDPATDIANEIRDVTVVLLGLAMLAGIAGVGLIVWRGYRGVVQFFYYMSPIAVAASAILAFQVRTDDLDLPQYDQEVTSVEDADGAPVFILVFDGLGYDIILDEHGDLDAEHFPGLKTLASDGVSLSNATSNNFWSMDSVPMVTDPAVNLSDRYNVRLYTEYTEVERRYYDRCGVTITCRGARYLTESAPLQVAAQLAVRSVYQATPESAESAVSRPMGWFLDRLGWTFPSADDDGWHFFTKRSFKNFLNDLDAEDSYGRLYIVHVMVPHHPNSFDEDGDAVPTASTPTEPDKWEQGYKDQSRFADKLVGDLIDKLQDEGIFEESTVIVTADHGPRTAIPSETVEPANVTPRVPLIIHAPTLDEHGVVMDVDYQHVDFGETLADVLGLPQPHDGDSGISAFATVRPERDKEFSIRGLRFVYDAEDDAWHHAEAN